MNILQNTINFDVYCTMYFDFLAKFKNSYFSFFKQGVWSEHKS